MKSLSAPGDVTEVATRRESVRKEAPTEADESSL